MSTYDSMPPKTLADYLAIAVSPLLIMLMVGSLNFFLAEVGYRGAFTGQVYWTLFWFTMASVLVSRISIEQGSAYGSLYGLALGAATAFRLVPFLGAPWGALILLGLIWWCASKLTWDCTVIDDHADASEQGLIEHLKTPQPKPAAHEKRDDALPGPRKPKPHAPGKWLIYVALGALPILGFGQWLIPASETGSRLRAFALAVVFVAASVGLLLTASFAGLRRYLRQRRLSMPTAMAGAWMARGAAVAIAVLVGALLLPRPQGFDTWANLGMEIRARDPRASKFAWMPGEAARGEGRRIGKSGDARPGGDQANARARMEGKVQGEGEASGEQGRPGTEGADRTTPGNERGGARSTDSPAGTSTGPSIPEVAPGGLLSLIRWVSLLLAILAVAWVIWRFGPQCLAVWREWQGRRRTVQASRSPEAGPPRRRFADFADPFRRGEAGRMTPDELAIYTFEAMEAWAADHGRQRPPDQTPLAFGREIEAVLDSLAEEVRATVRLYLRAAYGGGGTTAEETEPLRRLWLSLGSAKA